MNSKVLWAAVAAVGVLFCAMLAFVLVESGAIDTAPTSTDTIEEAEELCEARGIELEDKQELEQWIAPRAYEYSAGGVPVGLVEFSEEKQTGDYAKMLEGLAGKGGATPVVLGLVVAYVGKGPEAERGRVLEALRDN